MPSVSEALAEVLSIVSQRTPDNGMGLTQQYNLHNLKSRDVLNRDWLAQTPIEFVPRTCRQTATAVKIF